VQGANAAFSTRAFDLPIAVFTVGLGANLALDRVRAAREPDRGRVVFPLAGPLFRAR